MVTNDLGACEWFVWDLRRSSLIDRGQLDQIVTEFLRRNPRAEAPALAEYLVKQGTLTAFQADRILNSKSAGLVLGPYVLMDAIGQGSMGQVFKASSKNDANFYAVKVLPRRSMWNVRLARRQVRSFGQFSHPAVIPFVDVGTAGGLHYLVWPLAEGQTLDSIVANNGRLPASSSANIALHIAQGLHAAHSNNIFHGLLKPSNVMIGSDNQATVLDFGIGSLLVENEGESLVDTMSTANTLTSGLDCAAPESVMDPTNRTPAGDQYSLGCTLYYCLTGRVPFPEGSAVEKMMAHQMKEPMAIQEFAADCPAGLCDIVAKLMAKKPEDRYRGVDEVVEALEPFIGDVNRDTRASNMGSGMQMTGLKATANSMRKGRSSGNRPGLGIGGGGGVATMAPPSTPAPSHQGTKSAPAARAFGNGFSPKQADKPSAPPPNLPTRNQLPTRANTKPPAEEIPLTHAEEPQSFPDAAKLSARWDEPKGDDKKTMGMAGILAAALTLGVLVYLGVKLLVLDQ